MIASAKNLGGFILASRVPNLLVIGYTQFATGYFLLQSKKETLTIEFLLFMISTCIIAAGGYIINDYFDQKIDMINKPDRVVVGTALRRRLALFGHLALTFLGILLGFFLDPFVGIIHIFSATALWVYSGYLKKIIIVDTLLLAFLTSLTLLIVMVYFKEFKLIVLAYALFGFITVFIRESLKDIVSAKGEKAFGMDSVPTTWGIRGAKWFILIFCLVGIGGMVYYLLKVPNMHIRILFLGISPIIIYAMFLLRKADKTDDFLRIQRILDFIIFIGLASIVFL